MYYIFLAMSSVFTFLIFHKVKKDRSPITKTTRDHKTPSSFECFLKTSFETPTTHVDEADSLSLPSDICRIRDSDTLSEIIVTIKGAKGQERRLIVALIDTGADISVLHPAVAALMPIQTLAKLKTEPKNKRVIRAVNGGVIRAFGELPLKIGLGEKSFSHDFLVLPNVTTPLIIGWDMMQLAKAQINLRRGEFCLKNVCVPLKHSIEGDLRTRGKKEKSNDDKDAVYDDVDLRMLTRDDIDSYLETDTI